MKDKSYKSTMGKSSSNAMHVESMQKPEKCYSMKATQKPNEYISRQNERQMKEAKKLDSIKYDGRYN